MAFSITIDFTNEVVANVPLESLSTEESMGIMSTGSATILEDATTPLLGYSVPIEGWPYVQVLDDDGLCVFLGYMTNWDVSLVSPSVRRVDIRFADPTIWMDRFFLGISVGMFTNWPDGNGGYVPIPDGGHQYDWGVQNVCGHVGLLVNAPVTIPFPRDDGANTIPSPLWDRTSIRAAVDYMAGLCGGVSIGTWYDHETHVFNFVPLGEPGTLVPPTASDPTPLLRLMPTPTTWTAAGIGFSETPDGIATVAGEQVRIANDFTGWALGAYVTGATDYMLGKEWSSGSSSYVTTVIQGGSGLAGIDAPYVLVNSNSTDWDVSLSYADRVLSRAKRPSVRGSVTYTGDLRFKVGQVVSVDYPSLGCVGNFYVQKVTTRWLSGTGLRQSTIEFGDAPLGRISQRKLGNDSQPAMGAAGSKVIQVDDVNLKPGASTTVTAQLHTLSGAPAGVAGIPINFWLVVTDAAGTVLYDSGSGSGSTDWTIEPASSTSDQSGKAKTTVTAGATPGQKGQVISTIAGDAITTI